jgi:hypothetical protein
MANRPNPRVKTGREEWPFERQGYEDTHQPAYASAPRLNLNTVPWAVRMEEFLGTIISGGAAVWAAWIGTAQGPNVVALITDPRPVELLGVGALVWLHAKWRRRQLAQ